VVDAHHIGTGEDLLPAIRHKVNQVDPNWQPLSVECTNRFGYFPGPADNHICEYIAWAGKYMPANYTGWIFRGDEGVDEATAKMETYASGDGPLDAEELEEFMVERGFRWQTLDIILSLLDGVDRYVLSVNVPNDGLITNLKSGGIVEVPAVIGADRIYGLAMGELPTLIASLLNNQLDIMDLNVEAAVHGSRKAALEGLILDPLVPNPEVAEKILDEMLVAQAGYLPQFQ
jgi:alpha-galactosidase/6-phospho-beta-glucosidase family protein